VSTMPDESASGTVLSCWTKQLIVNVRRAEFSVPAGIGVIQLFDCVAVNSPTYVLC